MPGRKPHVVVVGSSNTDMVVACGALPGPGETRTDGVFYTAAGGKGANQAVAAARCGGKGARVTFVGAFGDDELGRTAIRGLLAEGIDCRLVRIVRGTSSGVALIFVDSKGENQIAVAPGANAHLAVRDIERARNAIRSADVVLAQLETPLDAVRRALELAREAGARTVLNPAPAPAEPLADSLLGMVSVLTPNETEFEALTGVRLSSSGGERAARKLAAALGEALVVTEGSRGLSVFPREGSPWREPAFEVKAVDAVGAGDAFSGALAEALAEGMELRRAVGFASAAAAISVTRRGAQPSMPKRREVLAFLRQHEAPRGRRC